MLTLNGTKDVEFCDGLSRRDFMKVGGLGVMGLTMAELLVAQQAQAAAKQEMNCIILFLVGAPGHLDTWDLKPDAPAEIRGPFKPIATNVAGIRISEHLPLCARIADKYCLVRSVTHERSDHEGGSHYMATGWNTFPAQKYPMFGTVVQ